MHCKRCTSDQNPRGGRIFIEGVFGEDHNSWLELYCLACGNRWLLDLNGKYAGFVKRVLKAYKYADLPR